jgi:hypothetical protein
MTTISTAHGDQGCKAGFHSGFHFKQGYSSRPPRFYRSTFPGGNISRADDEEDGAWHLLTECYLSWRKFAAKEKRPGGIFFGQGVFATEKE